MSDPGQAAGLLAPRAISIDDLVAREGLRHLVTTYGHAIDRRDWALLRTLYHDDGVDDHTPYYCGPVDGFIAWLPDAMSHWQSTMHVALDSLFVIEGDTAQGEVRALAWHLTADGTRQFVAWGRYADHYRRSDGAWRFARRSFILDFAEDLPVAAGDSFGSEGVATGKAGGEDPVYRRLEQFGRSRGLFAGQS